MNEKGAELLRGVKLCVKHIRNSSTRHIGEDNVGLVLLFIRLEDILRRGLRQKRNSDYYDYLASCLRKDLDYGCYFKQFENLSDLKTSTGKGRALLRHVASLGLLGSFLRCCFTSKVTASWYASHAYLRDKIFTEKFLTVIFEVDSYKLEIEIRTKEIDFSWPFEELLERENGSYFLPTEESERTKSTNSMNVNFQNGSFNSLQDATLEEKLRTLETNCEEMTFELSRKEDELRKAKEEMDYLRQLTVILRSSPDGAVNTSQSSIELNAQSVELKNASLIENHKSAYLHETGPHSPFSHNKSTDDSTSSTGCSQSSNAEVLIEGVTKGNELLRNDGVLKDSKSCQTDDVQIDANRPVFKDEKVNSVDEGDRVSVYSFQSASENRTGAEATNPLIEELEKLGRKYSEALTQIAEFEDLNETSIANTGRPKISSEREKNAALRAQVKELKAKLSETESNLVEKEESYQRVLALSEASQLEVQKLRNSLQLRDEEIKDLQDAKMKTAEQNIVLQSTVDTASAEIRRLDQMIRGLELDLNSSQSRISELSNSKRELEECLGSSERELTSLNRQIVEVNEELSSLYSSSENQVKVISAERDSIQTLYLDVKRELFIKEKMYKDSMNEKVEQFELMKHKLMSLTKEKDVMWQQLDRVQEISQSTLTGDWVNAQDVKKCALCGSLFSLFLRKHHCRSCGNVFCIGCSNNFMALAHSSRKERVCITCFNNRIDARILLNQQKINSPNLNSEEEQKFKDDVEDSFQKHMSRKRLARSAVSLANIDNSFGSSPMGSVDNLRVPQLLRSATVNIIPVDSNSNSALDQSGGLEMEAHRSSFQDSFSRPETPNSGNARPTLRSSPSISILSNDSPAVDLRALVNCPLEKTIYGATEKRGELFLPPARSVGFPLQVDTSGSTIAWSFSSEPKSIQFALLFQQASEPTSGGSWTSRDSGDSNFNKETYRRGASECAEGSTTPTQKTFHVIIPLITCKSHLEPVSGEVLVKAPGIYTIYFDNSFSKYTAKKVEYFLSVS